MGTKKFYVQKALGLKILGQKKSLVPKILGHKEFVLKSNFGSKIIFGPKSIGSKKNFGPKIILGPNDFVNQKFGSHKMLVQKYLSPNMLAPKCLVKIGSSIDDMGKCYQDKWCMKNVILTYGF